MFVLIWFTSSVCNRSLSLASQSGLALGKWNVVACGMVLAPYLLLVMPLFVSFFGAQAPAMAEPAVKEINCLAVGPRSKVNDTVSIQVNPPMEFDWKMREDVLKLRAEKVKKYPQLLQGDYWPNPAIFGAIDDEKAWWGIAGSCVWGSGTRSIDGLSEESRFIMNPYLLVAANPGNLMIWNPKKITDKDVNDPEFPFFWKPSSLSYNPKTAVAIATYNITEYQKSIAATRKLKAPTFCTQFSLVAYNARDFGYKYIFLDTQRSVNVQNDNNPRRAVRIRQMIHCGGTCGYPGGCNNMSPFMAEIDRCRFTNLPARAVVRLWKEAPISPQSTPDFYFLLEFR